MFLLDTVIISEIRKKKPDSGVLRWVSQQQDNPKPDEPEPKKFKRG